MGDGRRRYAGASKLTIVAVLGILVVGSLLSAIPAAASSGIAVYVSYADSFRANATNFPTPWLGSPRSTFEGCAPVSACTYDAGAIRVVNNTGSSVTVNAVAVHIDTCTYTGWPSAVLAPGADLIVTQLGSGEGAGCTGPTPAFFDTSDIGPGGSDYVGNCTPDGITPIVEITVDGITTTYMDSGQVLNTGGFDGGVCTGNESIQWTKIGSPPCRGSLLTLAPLSQTDRVLSTATVTATFTNVCPQGFPNQPLSNVAVDFSVTAGPNTGLSGSAVTDANGMASFSYSSSRIGTDTLQASITNIAGSITSNPVTVTWIVNFAPGGGAFVISDLKDMKGGAVYWWGAQWWKNDHLSSGLAPASFKGYENGNATPWCGQTWTTRPGNSSRPPQAVAANADMAVIVASQVTKRGPVISGNIVAVVLVHTNPGYGPNPGHPGTGTIVATLCSTNAAASLTPRTGSAPTAPTAPTAPVIVASQPAVVTPRSASPTTPDTSTWCAPARGKSGGACASNGHHGRPN